MPNFLDSIREYISGFSSPLVSKGGSGYVSDIFNPLFKPKASPEKFLKPVAQEQLRPVAQDPATGYTGPEPSRSPVRNLISSIGGAFRPKVVSGSASPEKLAANREQFQRDFGDMGGGIGVPRMARAEAVAGYQAPAPAPVAGSLVTEFADKAPFPQELLPTVSSSAEAAGVDPQMIIGILSAETGGTGYQPWEAIGPEGEVSFGQIIPKWHYPTFGFDSPQSYENYLLNAPREEVIPHVTEIYRGYLEQFGDPFLALAAYNAGPNNIEAGIPYATAIYNRIGYPIPGEQ